MKLALFLKALPALGLLAAAPLASAQLEATWEAHGGAEKWKSYGSLAYDCEFTMGPMELNDRQVYDLRTRDGLITAADGGYRIGAQGGEVWVAGEPGEMPMPPRFYMWTPFYFFGLPLILSDPGVNLKPEGQAEFEGKTYDLVRATFGEGVGDAHEDFYLCYIDPASKELKLAVYIVTYASLRKAEKLEEIPTSAAIYREWQSAGGLKLPAQVELVHWKEGAPDGPPKGGLRFTKVELGEQQAESGMFAKPEGAAVDESHLAAGGD